MCQKEKQTPFQCTKQIKKPHIFVLNSHHPTFATSDLGERVSCWAFVPVESPEFVHNELCIPLFLLVLLLTVLSIPLECP